MSLGVDSNTLTSRDGILAIFNRYRISLLQPISDISVHPFPTDMYGYPIFTKEALPIYRLSVMPSLLTSTASCFRASKNMWSWSNFDANLHNLSLWNTLPLMTIVYLRTLESTSMSKLVVSFKVWKTAKMFHKEMKLLTFYSIILIITSWLSRTLHDKMLHDCGMEILPVSYVVTPFLSIAW